MQLGELCERLNVPYRQARYVLEEDILPPGVEKAPQRGNFRDLTLDQAFWLGIVLKLKETGLKAPMAEKIARQTAKIFAKVDTRRPDSGFAPFEGRLLASLDWYVEMTEMRVLRLVAEAKDSREPRFVGHWLALDDVTTAGALDSSVSVRVNLTRIARLLQAG